MKLQNIKPKNPRIFARTFLKDAYIKMYPNDELGKKINPKLDLEHLRIIIDRGMDLYKWLGVSDSLVRQHCFEILAKYLEVDYSVVFNKWLLG